MISLIVMEYILIFLGLLLDWKWNVKRGVNNPKVFVLSNWKDGVVINSSFLGRVQEFCSRLAKFLRCLVDIIKEMSSQQVNK